MTGPMRSAGRSARARTSSPPFSACFGSSSPRGELQRARALAERLLRLAQAQPDPLLLPAAHVALGATLFHLGEPAAARSSSRTGPPCLRSPPAGGTDPPVWGRRGGRVPALCPLCAAGARLSGSGARAQPRKRWPWPKRCPTPLPWLARLAFSAYFYQFRREGRTAQARAESAIDLVAEHGLSPVWGAQRNARAGLGACGAGTGRRGDCAHAPRPRGLSDPRRLPLAAVSPWAPG